MPDQIIYCDTWSSGNIDGPLLSIRCCILSPKDSSRSNRPCFFLSWSYQQSYRQRVVHPIVDIQNLIPFTSTRGLVLTMRPCDLALLSYPGVGQSVESSIGSYWNLVIIKPPLAFFPWIHLGETQTQKAGRSTSIQFAQMDSRFQRALATLLTRYFSGLVLQLSFLRLSSPVLYRQP